MFDIGWSEMLVIAVVVIVVVGPKELPGMLRTFGRTTSKLRVMANDFRKQFDDAMKEAELDDLKKVADDVRALNPTNEIKKALSPMEKAAQDVRSGLDAAFKPAAKPDMGPDTGNEPAAAVAKPAEPLKQGAAALPGEGAASATAAEVKKAPASKSKQAPAATAAKPKKAAASKPAPAPQSKPKPKAEAPAKAAAKPRATKTGSRGAAS